MLGSIILIFHGRRQTTHPEDLQHQHADTGGQGVILVEFATSLLREASLWNLDPRFSGCFPLQASLKVKAKQSIKSTIFLPSQ